jgi:DNA polymerase I-like protein with 3'-5' exonuclease and polymerase domains
MIDWQTVSYVAGALGTAVTSIDKIYRGYADFFKKKVPDASAPAPDFSIQNRSSENAMVATSLHTGAVYQTVKYEDLRGRLTPTDRAHIEALSQALENYEKQWNAAVVAKSMASGMDVGRYDAQLDYLAKQISAPLLQVLSFVERMGLFLDDHYLAARSIATEYLKTGK